MHTDSMKQLFRDVDGGPLCPEGSVVCIGAFDGLHLGHRALVGHAAARARTLGLPLATLSFEPLPREFFAPAAPPPRLMLPRARAEGLWALGADVVGLLRFNAAFAAMSPEAFATRVLAGRRSYLVALLYDNPSGNYLMEVEQGVLGGPRIRQAATAGKRTVKAIKQPV